MNWKLKRTKQCKKCPWRKDVDPHEIPNGYCEIKHKGLEKTIADQSNPMESLRADKPNMACHETDDAHCVGWLMNQLGEGNNIGLRIKMLSCENRDKIKLVGDQHRSFEDTLPKHECACCGFETPLTQFIDDKDRVYCDMDCFEEGA